MKERFPLLTMAGEMAVYSYSVQCTGTESTLTQYSHNTIGSSSISHNDDVSYQCIESK